MSLQSETKFEEKLTLGSKNDMTNVMNFQPTTQKYIKNFTLMDYFYPKYMRFELKNTLEELSFMTLNSDGKFE